MFTYPKSWKSNFLWSPVIKHIKMMTYILHYHVSVAIDPSKPVKSYSYFELSFCRKHWTRVLFQTSTTIEQTCDYKHYSSSRCLDDLSSSNCLTERTLCVDKLRLFILSKYHIYNWKGLFAFLTTQVLC